jgi:hypothetical protein
MINATQLSIISRKESSVSIKTIIDQLFLASFSFFFFLLYSSILCVTSLALLHKCNGSRKRRDDITCIDYSHANLSSVPDDILAYENTLEELHLEANCLQELPKVTMSP